MTVGTQIVHARFRGTPNVALPKKPSEPPSKARLRHRYCSTQINQTHPRPTDWTHAKRTVPHMGKNRLWRITIQKNFTEFFVRKKDGIWIPEKIKRTAFRSFKITRTSKPKSAYSAFIPTKIEIAHIISPFNRPMFVHKNPRISSRFFTKFLVLNRVIKEHANKSAEDSPWQRTNAHHKTRYDK